MNAIIPPHTQKSHTPKYTEEETRKRSTDYHRKRRQEQAEKTREYNKKYYQQRKEQDPTYKSEYYKAYYAKEKEDPEYKAERKAYKINNQDKIKETVKKYTEKKKLLRELNAMTEIKYIE